MSYTSKSVLGSSATLVAVKEAIDLLGYIRLEKECAIPNQVGSYMWVEEKDYNSYVGVELQLHRDKNGKITIDTRSRLGRSYWDLLHQNKTLKLMRDFFGGYFETDAGRNRYWRPEGNPPKPVSSGCFLARWRLYNALIKPIMYLEQRGLDQPNAKKDLTGIEFIDEMNPRLFSNNMVLPYLFAVWENYFRESFVAILIYSPNRSQALKKANINILQLEPIAASEVSVEQAVADIFSFQRPSKIAGNFRFIDSKIDIAGVLKKPYKHRKKSLYDQIEEFVNNRNEFVHSGCMNTNLTDEKLQTFIKDIEAAVERCYQEFGRALEFSPSDKYR